ncbi:MAG TPA: hypothetical protein VF172_12700 [Nitrososphaera sp.]
MAGRDVEKILWFRNDISPFLVHLTRTIKGGNSAKTNLESIIRSKQLNYGNKGISDARWGYDASTLYWNPDIEKKFFSAVSLVVLS